MCILVQALNTMPKYVVESKGNYISAPQGVAEYAIKSTSKKILVNEFKHKEFKKILVNKNEAK